MEPRDLVKVWDAPDNSKLTAKQWSIRLPIHVAAKINALCEMYPRKTKTEIIGDLLATALDQFEEGLSAEDGELMGKDSDGEPLYALAGPLGRFRELSRKYLKEQESESDPK